MYIPPFDFGVFYDDPSNDCFFGTDQNNGFLKRGHFRGEKMMKTDGFVW
jgi:hypothetical protein